MDDIDRLQYLLFLITSLPIKILRHPSLKFALSERRLNRRGPKEVLLVALVYNGKSFKENRFPYIARGDLWLPFLGFKGPIEPPKNYLGVDYIKYL